MTRPVTTLISMMPLVWGGAALAGEQTITLAVDKMYCGSCPLTVETAIKGVSGVKSVKASYENKSAVVVFDDARTTVDAIAAASTNAGYPARLAERQGS
jgi:mercuric ion binding protein